MLIILEGADLAGKTYLAQEIAQRIGTTPVMLHRGPPREHVLLEYEREIEGYHPGHNMNVVCDRWYLGELVYGPLLRDSIRMDEPMRRHISMLLASRGALHVILDPPTRVLKERYLRQGDKLVSLELLTGVKARYQQLFRELIFQERTLIGDGNPDTVIRLAQLEEREADNIRTVLSTYVGPPRPRFLLLGDRINNPKNARHTTAFVPYASTSGHFLLSAIDMFTWQHLGIVNACEPSALPGDLYTSWVALGRPATVALGVHAHVMAQREEIPHGSVPHPQYARRFHYHSIEHYRQELTLALKREEERGTTSEG